MYVIYINDRPLTLLSTTELSTRVRALKEKDGEHATLIGRSSTPNQSQNTHLVVNYSGKPRTLLHYVDMLEKGSPRVFSVDIVSEDLERLWEDFKGKHKWVPAAGGIVWNKKLKKTLFIFRRGSWDLPKGKIDDGENASSAALREVEEETGVSDLVLGEKVPTTYHTYRNRKDKRVLKPTYWFRMTTEQEKLVPEKEEDIERAEWLVGGELLAGEEPLYRSLSNLLEQL